MYKRSAISMIMGFDWYGCFGSWSFIIYFRWVLSYRYFLSFYTKVYFDNADKIYIRES